MNLAKGDLVQQNVLQIFAISYSTRFGEVSGFSQNCRVGLTFCVCWRTVCKGLFSLTREVSTRSWWVRGCRRRGRLAAPVLSWVCANYRIEFNQRLVRSMIFDEVWILTAPRLFQSFRHAVIILCCPHEQCPPQLKKSDIPSAITFPSPGGKVAWSRSLSMEVFCHVEVWNSKVKSDSDLMLQWCAPSSPPDSLISTKVFLLMDDWQN